MIAANRAEILRRVAEKTDYSSERIEPIVNSVFETMAEILMERQEIYIHNFGKFGLKKVKAINTRHPGTGEPIKIAARYIVTFNALPKLKKAISKLPVTEE